MRMQLWRQYLATWQGKASFAAIVLLLGASLNGMVMADITRVKQLEFSRVQLIGDNELEITQGDEPSMRIRGHDDEGAPPPFVLVGDQLRLGVTDDGDRVEDVQFKLTVSELSALELYGSGDVYVKPLQVADLVVSVDGSGEIRMFDVEAGDLEMEVEGSGAIQAVNVTADSAMLNLKGSGDIELGSLKAGAVTTVVAGSGDILIRDGGSTDAAELVLMGSGDIKLEEFFADAAEVSIMGSGDVELGVRDSLEVEIMGSGDLVYFGSPEVSKTILGSGDVEQRDGK